VLGRRPLGAILHSSNEPGEHSQWLCLDDSTINVVLDIIIIIIFYYYYYYYFLLLFFFIIIIILLLYRPIYCFYMLYI